MSAIVILGQKSEVLKKINLSEILNPINLTTILKMIDPDNILIEGDFQPQILTRTGLIGQDWGLSDSSLSVYGITINGKKRTSKEILKLLNTKKIELEQNLDSKDDVKQMKSQIMDMKMLLESCLLK